jgi:hypothetical protein
MSEPRNVTPEGQAPEGMPPEGPGPHGAPPPGAPPGTQPTAAKPEWWTGSWDSRRRGFPLLGVLLVLIGVGLLIQYLVPAVSVGTLILLAIGVAFLAAWLIGRSWFSMVPGFLVLALGVGELLEDLAVFGAAHQTVPGLAAAALAVGFLIIWIVARISGRRWMWPLWAAAVFGVIAAAQLSTFIVLPQFGAIVAILVIVLGVIVLFNWRRGRG